jgi:gamma-glutamylcyclotransferase (GGCT)/AIG2-like uncharacterized protein YtfP
MPTLVFVYGTLKRGERNHHVLAAAQPLGPAVTQEARFTLREYPSASSPGRLSPSVETGGAHRIAGELYAVDADVLARLDTLERVGVDYRRQAIPLASGEMAEIYLRAAASRRPALPELTLARLTGDLVDWSEIRYGAHPSASRP